MPYIYKFCNEQIYYTIPLTYIYLFVYIILLIHNINKQLIYWTVPIYNDYIIISYLHEIHYPAIKYGSSTIAYKKINTKYL